MGHYSRLVQFWAQMQGLMHSRKARYYLSHCPSPHFCGLRPVSMWSLTLSSTRNKYAPQFSSDRWCEEAGEWKLSRDNGFYEQVSIPAMGLSLGLFRKLSLPLERTTTPGVGGQRQTSPPLCVCSQDFFCMLDSSASWWGRLLTASGCLQWQQDVELQNNSCNVR